MVQVDKAGLNEILEDIENSSREESGYVVIDVVSSFSILPHIQYYWNLHFLAIHDNFFSHVIFS